MTGASNATFARVASSFFKYNEYVSTFAISATTLAKTIDNSIGSTVY